MDEFRLVVGAATETGQVREENEDAIFEADPTADIVATNGMLVAVADGMGGYQRGEVAAQIAIDVLREEYYGSEVAPAEIPDRLRRSFRRANQRIYEGGTANGEESMMGTTLVAAVIRGNDLTIANVGDSRAYLIRANRATQVTRDHSLVAEQVAAGAMTAEEARESQHRNIITRALGHSQRVDVDIFEIRLLADDRLILTSDGTHDYVDESDLVEITMKSPPEQAAKELIALAMANESNDNASAVVAWAVPAGVSLEPEPEAEVAERSALLVPILVLVGLMIFIAIVVVILQLG